MNESIVFRFHVDRRGRILVENFTADLRPLAGSIEPGHPLAAPAPRETTNDATQRR